MGDMRKHVAVLMGQADEEFQARFLRGFSDKAATLDLDVSVFSMRMRNQTTTEREIGDASVFHAVNFSLFDAVVVMADTIQASGVVEHLENRIRDEFHGPVLFVDGDSECFPVLWTDNVRPMKALVDYLVDDCDYRDFAFLTGKKWNRHAQIRLEAFRNALKDHWIELDEDRVYDGDFWYTSGMSCVRKMLDSGRALPQVVVCANDIMAIGLCGELEKNGLRVPDDIAVAGFDSFFEGRTSPKGITSAALDAQGCGAHVAGELVRLMQHQDVRPHVDQAPTLITGGTCRCNSRVPAASEAFGNRRWTWETYDSRMSYSALHSTFDDDLIAPKTLEEFLQVVWSHLMRMVDIEEYYLVLDNAWSNPDAHHQGSFSTGSLSNEVICALHYISGNSTDGMIQPERRFPLFQMLPDLQTAGGDPVLRFFVPLFFEDRAFGYAVAVFKKNGNIYDKEFRLYTDALSRALEVLMRSQMLAGREIEIEGFGQNAEQKEKKTTRRELTRDEKKEYKETMKILDQNLFRYFFQPIVSAETGEIYSYEALMRADSALPISPLNLIRYAQMDGRLYDIERDTLMNVLNIITTNEIFEDKKVFINSIPGVLLNDEDRTRIEGLLKKRADNVVIEITEQAEMGDEELENLKERYRGLGTRIALDDYGMGYSNAGNLLRYMPDIVKIDRTLLSDIEKNKQKQHFVREIIDFCHDNGMLALAEGVETPEEMRTVIRFGADLIQGYYTGRPAPEPVESINENVRSEIRRYQQERQDGSDQTIFAAGKSSRVLMSNLIKEGITHILVGEDRMAYRDIAFAGAPGQRANIHMEVARGYEGVITLENVCLANIKNRPCIEIGEGARVILILMGNSILTGNGIHVCDGSDLRIEGSGNLEIRVNGDDYYGIGGGRNERHGKITFSQDGEIRINANGNQGVCIGSGKGGGLEINRGRYNLLQSGQSGVGIGSVEGYEHFILQDCELSADATLTNCVILGSLRGSSDITIERAAVRLYGAAKRLVAIGSLDGVSTAMHLADGNVDADLQMDMGTAIGSFAGATQVDIQRAGMKIDVRGQEALGIGGANERIKVSFDMANVRCDVRSEQRCVTKAPAENLKITESRCRFIVNGAETVL
ncbi:MAG: EAL domain-containing protein [Lachnospiraceae bacterium]|nr:EAL domain-containing protein [Lachnospiraceae bacterium]